MTAYAALMSLLNTMDHVHNHPRLSSSLDMKQMESLTDILGFFQEFTNSRPPLLHIPDEEDMEIQIASAAYATEDLIESHVVDQIHASGTSVSLLDLHKLIQEMASIKEKAVKVAGDRRCLDLHRQHSNPASVRARKMIGFEDDLFQLIGALTNGQSSRHQIPVIGMGGSGKTTLAQNVYDHPLIARHFDFRAWATVSSDYIMSDILLQLLSCQRSPTVIDTERQLEHRLHQRLVGTRYLIILDDVWSIEAWARIKSFLPDDNNGSRIIVTTRQSSVAMRLSFPRISIKSLDEDTSWKLFCEEVFADEQLCPPQLEQIGKEIVKQCKGHPLSIVMIAGILRRSSMTQEYWEMIEEDVNSVLNSRQEGQWREEVLSSSYNYLPVHLKSCFLYMVLIFPEDDDVHVSELVRLWMAEGFLKPKQSRSPEEVAEGYVRDLVERNLIVVRSLRSNRKIKTCCIHHGLRDICLRIAQKEKFIHVMNEDDQGENVDSQRRIVFHQRIEAEESHPQVFMQSASLARTLICSGVKLPLKCRLLRILKFRDSIYADVFQEAIFQQVNLRYLVCSISRLPKSISLLWNLQTLVLRGKDPLVDVPPEIWCLPLLRHLKLPRFCLPDPPRGGQQDDFVLCNLQTLKAVRNFKCTEEVFSRIPNIKKLRIEYDDFSSGFSRYCLHNLGQLRKLESLNCRFYGSPNRDDLLQNLTFPSSLQKLTLAHCDLDWEDLTIVGSLPNLEVLNLLWYSVSGTEWSPVEGEFPALMFLKIVSTNLVYWNAEGSHFPSLEYLVLQGLDHLNEIPIDVGDLPSLLTIKLDGCSESAAISAMRILEEQENLGNDELQVRIRFRDKAQVQRLEEEMEMPASCKTRLHIDAYDSDDSADSYLTFDVYSSDD